LAQASKIMIVRHAEKPVTVGDQAFLGVREDGTEDKESLIVRGWQRAGALCTLFPTASRGLAVPDGLFAADPEKANGIGSKSRRPQQTITPLSERLGLQIDLSFAKGQEAEVAAAAVARGGVVLIAWQHEAVPAIAQAIPGGDVPATKAWPDDRFDIVWGFDLAADGRYTFTQVPQALLPGDQPAA
jgi:hypothetical protein